MSKSTESISALSQQTARQIGVTISEADSLRIQESIVNQKIALDENLYNAFMFSANDVKILTTSAAVDKSFLECLHEAQLTHIKAGALLSLNEKGMG